MTAQDYIRKIRNPAKRDYAWDYLLHLRGDWPEPTKPVGLSTMAAQAVRMELNRLNHTLTDETKGE